MAPAPCNKAPSIIASNSRMLTSMLTPTRASHWIWGSKCRPRWSTKAQSWTILLRTLESFWSATLTAAIINCSSSHQRLQRRRAKRRRVTQLFTLLPTQDSKLTSADSAQMTNPAKLRSTYTIRIFVLTKTRSQGTFAWEKSPLKSSLKSRIAQSRSCSKKYKAVRSRSHLHSSDKTSLIRWTKAGNPTNSAVSRNTKSWMAVAMRATQLTSGYLCAVLAASSSVPLSRTSTTSSAYASSSALSSLWRCGTGCLTSARDRAKTMAQAQRKKLSGKLSKVVAMKNSWILTLTLSNLRSHQTFWSWICGDDKHVSHEQTLSNYLHIFN